MKNRAVFFLVTAPIVILFAVSAIRASSSKTTAMLHGIVTDPSGAAIPGALVTVSRGEFVHSVSTDETGQYALRGLAPGHYSVWIHSTGFAPLKRAGLVLSAGYETEGDAQLVISVQTQEITVTGRAVHYAAHTSESVGAVK